MKRGILLIDFIWGRDKDPRMPLGQASLMAALKRIRDLDIRSVSIALNKNPNITPEQITSHIMKTLTDMPVHTDLAFGVYVWGEIMTKKVLKQLRKSGYAGKIILGGPQITYTDAYPEKIYPEADIFIRGYAEDVLTRLMEGESSIRGIHVAGQKDRREQAVSVLENLPSPWLEGIIPLSGQHFIRWESQRGCQFRCAFCQHRAPGNWIKPHFFPQDRIESEIKLFSSASVKEIAVLDPIFNTNTNPEHAIDVMQKFRQHGFTGRLALQARAEFITDEFLEAARGLDIKLEFGLQTIHRHEETAIQRTNNLNLFEKNLTKLNQHNIPYEISMIFGLPNQTVESFEKTIEWCLRLKVPVIKAFPLMLLRGTPLEHNKNRWHMVVDEPDGMPVVVESDTFDYADWQYMAQLSEALKKTKGNHPSNIRDLKKIARMLSKDLSRWKPVNSNY